MNKNKDLIDWREYCQKSFEEAKEKNKPIFLLLTAPAWCHWCHVYESSSHLYHPEVYQVINEKFIPILVDADKRQDLTRLWLEGGWPTTVLLTKNREKITAYSGAIPVHEILNNLNYALGYNENTIKTKLKKIIPDKAKTKELTEKDLSEVIEKYRQAVADSYDKNYGGFGFYQKFPQPRTLFYCLKLYKKTRDNAWLEIVQNTLKNQVTDIKNLKTEYLLFDPVEGGFHRYSTQQDWSSPHYEKMLYDNARSLKTYSYLLHLTKDKLAEEVVKKTLKFIEKSWYDKENGGFFGSTDAFTEEEYYSELIRPEEKPEIEKTKYTDWNSEAVIAYLFLYKLTKNQEYRMVAEKTLGFFEENILTENGPYHYILNGIKNVRGCLLDNSYLLLAFVEAYKIINKKEYLNVSIRLADYALKVLYDEENGGFFERNSPDKELYALGEEIDYAKPVEENGIICFALINLYLMTKNKKYLLPAIRTLSLKIDELSGLDNIYYFIVAAENILKNKLLKE